MTPEELKQALLNKGWNISTDGLARTGLDWYAWLNRYDRKSARDCMCNEKPPSFLIRPSHFVVDDGITHGSVTFELCGEVPGGQWVKFEVYSVQMADALKTIEPAKRILIAAWVAAWESAEQVKNKQRNCHD